MSDVPSLSMAELPEMNPGPVCRLCTDGRIELANRAARDLFAGDLIGRNWFDVSPGTSRDAWTSALRGERDVSYEEDVGQRCFVFHLAHRPGSDHVFIYGSDVTDLKTAQRALKELARFPEKNPGPVARLDRTGCIILANKAARALFQDDQLAGKNWHDVCPGVTGEFWRRVVSGTATVRLDVRLNGREVTFAHVPPEGGSEIFVYGADVTAQNEAERALRQHERMATLGTLAAGLAHELNNPAAAARRAASHLREQFARLQASELELSALAVSAAERETMRLLATETRELAAQTGEFNAMTRSDLETAVEDWLDANGVADSWTLAAALVDLGYEPDDLDALATKITPAHFAAVVRWATASFEVNRLFDEVQHATTRLSEIVGAMKAYSFLGQAPVQDVDVNEGIRSTLIIMRSKLKEGVTVVEQLADDLPKIQAYGGELNQVWTNLIDNAVAAMNGKGIITLRSAADGDGVVVEVEDNGPGIAPENMSRIFDAFFTTKPPGQGTGLGLHTCYNIVVGKHEGTLDVKSKPGETRFIVRLPAACPLAEGRV